MIKIKVLDIAKVPYEFRESYPCDYAYLIKDFKIYIKENKYEKTNKRKIKLLYVRIKLI